MYQAEMFKGAHRSWAHIGEGLISVVHSSPCGAWVVKHGGRRDGTLNYLEWCLLHQQAGTSMQGMPYVDSIVHTEEGYVATLKRYSDWKGTMARSSYDFSSDFDYADAPYLLELAQAFCKYMNDVFDADIELENLDLHGGNHMYDKENDEWILLDPSAALYKETPCAEHLAAFALQ